MKFTPIAVTETGNQTNMAWYNDYTEKQSKLVHQSDIPEIMGCADDELEDYNSLEEMESDTRPHGNYSFSENPVF